MRRAVSSWLLYKPNGFSSPWRIVSPIPNNIFSTRAHEYPIRHYTLLGKAAELGPFKSKPYFTYNVTINGRERYGTCCLHSFTLRSYATMWGSSSQASTHAIHDSKKKSQATLMYLVALVLAMVGCSYAAVPLYRKFCQATGYGGTVRRRETVEEKIARHAQDGVTATRQLVVQFNADVADGLPWKFTPTQRQVRVKPGQSTLAFFTAENLSSKPITGVSTYNVTPMKAGAYFNKIQCFCFEEQRLLPGEKIDMPWASGVFLH